MSSLLVTGGTGTIGQAVVRYYLDRPEFERIVIFSRDEHKQWEMERELKSSKLRFFLGDIRDKDRIKRASEGVDVIVHAAALKQIGSGVHNPLEVAKTNVDGTMNVIDAALDNNIARMVLISTDKAVEPTCLYGATKLVAEGLVLHAKAYQGSRRTTFSVVRMGNIAFSRGSVLPLFKELKAQNKKLPVTSLDMTRYWVDKEQACELIHKAIFYNATVYTPKAIAFRMNDLVQAFEQPYHIVGLRDQERLFEKLDQYRSSDKPERFLTVEELKELIYADDHR